MDFRLIAVKVVVYTCTIMHTLRLSHKERPGILVYTVGLENARLRSQVDRNRVGRRARGGRRELA